MIYKAKLCAVKYHVAIKFTLFFLKNLENALKKYIYILLYNNAGLCKYLFAVCNTFKLIFGM